MKKLLTYILLSAFLVSGIVAFAFEGQIIIPKQTTTENTISIYPNPNNGLFSIYLNGTIENNFLKISILSVYGKTVFEKEYYDTSSPFTESYDFRNLPQGMYLVQIEVNGHRQTYRMMIR